MNDPDRPPPAARRDTSAALQRMLACPACHAPLRLSALGADCSGCGECYPLSDGGQLDLRLRREVVRRIEVRLSPAGLVAPDGLFDPLPSLRGRTGCGEAPPPRLTREFLARFPTASQRGELALDCGCGTAAHKDLLEGLGFEYVGLDLQEPQATLLGDAQALPFLDGSFAFVLSIAVLEHVPYPLAMTNEVYRVMKPGALLFGSVAFHEPFHGDSYYHHTHLGAWNVLRAAGFEVLAVSPSLAWDSLAAQAAMGLLPRAPAWLAKAVVSPVRLLRRAWFAVGYSLTGSKHARWGTGVLFNAGAYTLVARKPAEARAASQPGP